MPGKESRVYICVDDTSREEKIAHLRGETAIPRGSSTVREHSEHMEKDVFKSRGTLRQLLMNVKTPTPEINRK